MITVEIEPGDVKDAFEARLERWTVEDVPGRLWARDRTIWFDEAVPELADRLGWLDLPRSMAGTATALRKAAREIAAEGIERVLLLGMGGSSLAAEVFARIFRRGRGFPRLTVVDTTHPDAILALDESIDPARTFFLVSSKSGSTLETLSLFRHFWAACEDLPDRGRHFAAVTDPGSPLQQLAQERGFRHVFLAPPDVGGRFSALSPFGLVPAALMGLDPAMLLQVALLEAVLDCRTPGGSAVRLGALLGEAAAAGRDKLTFVAPPRLAPLTAWIEQLVAESTGKDGRGIVPVAGEAFQDAGAYGEDRLFVRLALLGQIDEDLELELDELSVFDHPVVRITLDSVQDLGGEMFRWETAVALAGAILGIHPFNQPDVQLAKELATRAMSGEDAGPPLEAVRAGEEDTARALGDWLGLARPGDYVAIQAFLAPGKAVDRALGRLRDRLIDAAHLPTTLGYGPRFLHSTGQLHKGGPNTGLFLQLVDHAERDLPIPETTHTFGRLIAAQADGDLAALLARGRRVLRVDLGHDAVAGLKKLALP